MRAWNDWDLSFATPGGGPVMAILLLLAVVFIAADARRVIARVRGARRATLIALRLLTTVAIAACIVQPEWLVQTLRNSDGQVALLFDTSRSMSIKVGERSRAEIAQALLSGFQAQPNVPAWLFTFGGDGAEPADAEALLEHYPAVSDETRLLEAVRSAVDTSGKDLGAVVLVSDGADSDGDIDPDAAMALKARVHTVFVGERGPARDDAIVSVRADPVAFLRQQSEVEVPLSAQPPRPGTVIVTLSEAGRVVREQPAELGADGSATVVIPFDVNELGRSVYTLSIPVLDGDAVPANNERAFLVRVKRDRLRVLLVCGRPTWDSRFLRAFLKGNPSIDLITFFILRTTNDMSMAAPDELSLIPFPTDELFREHLHSFDLVIFQDFNYGPYQMARYLPRVREYVLSGGSFAMVGGELSFGSGGYLRTPVGEILPVELPPGGEALLEQPFSPRIGAGQARHPLVSLLPNVERNRAAWAQLAPMLGANRLGPPREGSQVLLAHPDALLDNGNPMPVLVVGSAGKGRTMALAVDTSWRWGITTAGSSGDASAYERFWDRTLRWLSRDPMLDPAQLQTDRERYGPGAPLQSRMVLRDGAYAPLSARRIEVAILDSEDNVLSATTRETDAEGRARADLRAPEQPGGYRVAVRPSDTDGWLADEGIVVEVGGDELADPFPRPDTLEVIARATGGQAYAADEVPDLSQLPRGRTETLGTVHHNPVSTVWFFLVATGLFAAEWMLRRRWGLR